MTIRDLTIFSAVARHESMSKAANELGLAQPTVSSVIANLEAQYGVVLFDRLAKRLHITDEGRFFLLRSRSILALIDDLETELGSYEHVLSVSIGATLTVGAALIAPIIQKFEHLHTQAKVFVQVDNTKTIEGQLLDGALDFAVVEGEVENPLLWTTMLCRDELVLVASATYQLPSKRMSLKDVAKFPFIVREPGSGTRKQFLGLLQEQGLQVEQKWVCHTSDAIVSAVLSGQGLTVISKRLVRPYLDQGTLKCVVLEGVDLARTFSLIWHKDKIFTPIQQSLIALIQEEAGNS